MSDYETFLLSKDDELHKQRLKDKYNIDFNTLNPDYDPTKPKPSVIFLDDDGSSVYYDPTGKKYIHCMFTNDWYNEEDVLKRCDSSEDENIDGED